MPPYPGNDLAVLLYENKQGVAWQNEALAAGMTSQAFQLRRERGNFYPNGVSAEIAFSAAPGAFEIDVLTSDTDQLTHYVSIGSITAVNANNVGRIELTTIWARYIALQVKTLTNAVNGTALITR